MILASKEELKRILRTGDRLQAIRYAQDNFGVSLKDAVKLVNAVNLEMDPGRGTNPNFSKPGFVSIMVYTVLGLLAVLFLGISIMMLYTDQQSVNRFVKTSAIVIENHMDPDGEGESYTPVVSFQWDGREIISQGSIYTNPPSFDVGEEVALFVNPDNPNEVLIDSFGQRFTGILVFGILGLAFLIGIAAFRWVSGPARY